MLVRPAAAAIATLALALAAPLHAAPPKPAPAKPAPDARASADRFNLDLPAADAEATPPDAPAEPAPPAAAADAAPAGRFTLDTPIVALLADYRSKAVLDRDMPGLSTDKFLDQFKGLSLNQLAPWSDGRLTPALLEKVGRHLAEIE